MDNYKQSQYRLRKAIGILGLFLPLLLVLNYDDEILASMSHYYYTTSGVFFIGILFAFGLILLSYRGYEKESKKEFVGDNLATTIAGICILMTVLIPTAADGSLIPNLDEGVFNATFNNYLFGHWGNAIKNTVHLSSAGLFLIALGYMCHSKFTLSPGISNIKKKFYKICGWIIWLSVILLILAFAFEGLLKLNEYLPSYVLWLEWVAVWAFAVAWLVKGRIDEDVKKLTKN